MNRAAATIATALMSTLPHLAGCGADPSEEGAGPATVRDSAGVVLVEASGADVPLEPAPRRLDDVVPVLAGTTVVPWGVAVHGAGPGGTDRDDAPGGVEGRGVDPIVVVVDWVGGRVERRSLDGRSLGSLGGAGDGPGEFRSAVAVATGPDGVPTIWDAGRGLLSRWAHDGSLIDERRAPVAYFGPGFAVRADGGVVVVTADAGRDGLGQRLEVVDGAGRRSTLHSVTQTTPVVTLPCGTMPLPRVFTASIVWAAGADRVHVLRGPAYRIDTLVEGRVVGSVRRAVPPHRPTASDAAAAARGGPGPHAGILRRCGVTAEELVRAVGYEDEVSPVMFVAVDPTGGLWVTRTADGVRPGPVDVFAPDGRYRGTVGDLGIPAAFPDDSTVLAVQVDGEGRTGLVAWRWTPGGS